MDFTPSQRCTQWREATHLLSAIAAPEQKKRYLRRLVAGEVRSCFAMLLWQACWEIAQRDRATESSSRARVFISEGTARIVDRSVQLCGGLGTTEELAVGRIYADTRAFWIYDGASEVHRLSIARRVARRACAELASARA